MKKNLVLKGLLIIFLWIVFTVILPVAVAQTPASISELEAIQQEALAQIETELQAAVEDLQSRRDKELQVVENSDIKENKKVALRKRIETKYIDLERHLQDKYDEKKKSVVDYYAKMKRDLLNAMPKTDSSTHKPFEEVIFIPPQHLLGKWKISGQKFVGTLKFENHKGIMVSRVRFFMYNRWDDLFNLTYDGQNVAFDYENPYGVKLHFEGVVDVKENEIIGKMFDLKTDQVYPWKAYR